MKCNWEWLSAYLDGALAEDKRAKLEEHLKTCEACTAKLEEFARVEQVAKKIPAPQLSEAYWENFANRVQNKLTIREKQRTSPGWREALKGLFQPTTSKLAIAGSVAVLILLTFVSLEQWKNQTHRPPVFEAEKQIAEGKVDSVQLPAKDESAFRTVEKDNKVGLVEDKRLDQPMRERGTAALSQKPAENVPAATAPVGRILAVPEEQKSKEEPSLAAFAEWDEAVKGDSSLVIVGKKAEDTEKALFQSRSNLQKRSLIASPTKGQPQGNEANDTTSSSLGVKITAPAVPKESIQEWAFIKGGFDAQHGGKPMTGIDSAKAVSDSQEWSLIRGAGNAEYGGKLKLENETANRDSNRVSPTIDGGSVRNILNPNAPIDYARKKIREAENELRKQIPRTRAESLYVALGIRYLHLYSATSLKKDWKIADQRVHDFLRQELSDSTRQRLLQIQAELTKLKK